MDKYDILKIDNQLCFPLYAVSREVIKLYRPYLDKLDITYTQYITLMVLWEKRSISVKELGERLYLDSGTLTPVLKSLEKKGYVSRNRDKEDERVLIASITDKGMKLRDDALKVPKGVGQCVKISEEEARCMCSILHKMLNIFSENK